MNKLLILILSVFFISFVSASTQPLIVNNLAGNQQYDYVFNYTTDAGCTDVVLSYSETITTNNKGLAVVYVPLNLMTRKPNFLCEYRDGTLRKVHNDSIQFFDIVWTDNIYSKDWSNVSGTLDISSLPNLDIIESQITDLDHFESSDETDPTIWNTLFNNTLVNFLTSWFSGKTTDDLTQGSTNLYDNKTWNESLGDNLYVNIDGDTMTGDLTVDSNLNVDGNITSTGIRNQLMPNLWTCQLTPTSNPIITSNLTKSIEDGKC